MFGGHKYYARQDLNLRQPVSSQLRLSPPLLSVCGLDCIFTLPSWCRWRPYSLCTRSKLETAGGQMTTPASNHPLLRIAIAECPVCGQKTRNPKFCSRSCAAKMNNILVPKRKLGGKCSVCR